MRLVCKTLSLLLVLAISACSTMKPVQMSPSELQQNIAAGELLEPGDKVRLALDGGEHYELEVTNLSTDHITGIVPEGGVRSVFLSTM